MTKTAVGGFDDREHETGDAEEFESLEEMPRFHRGRYDWPRLCDGKVHWVSMPKDEVPTFRVNARRAAKARHSRFITRWSAEHEHEADGVIVGRLYIQAVPI